jgi:hypothetical protein
MKKVSYIDATWISYPPVIGFCIWCKDIVKAKDTIVSKCGHGVGST